MADPLRIRGSVAIPESELRWRFSRSGGPGGQGVNTSDSRVELLFDVARSPSLPPAWRSRALERLADRLVDGVVRVVAQDERSQLLNRRAAEARLVALLVEATAPPPRARTPTRPSRASVERRLRSKQLRAQTKRRRSGPED